MAQTAVVDLPASIISMVQDGTLEQAFEDALLPNFLFVDEAVQERFEGNLGTNITETRAGLLPVVTTPLGSGEEPTAQSYLIEQWSTSVNQYSGRLDTDLLAAGFTIKGKFLQDVVTLAKQAGMSCNRFVRNEAYNAYCGGHTVIDYSIGGDPGNVVTHRVSALAGFRKVLVNGTLVDVSATNPLAATAAASTAVSIVGVTPDDSDFPDGPGSVTFAVAVDLNDRDRLESSTAPYIMRATGANTIDGISAGDLHNFADLLTICAQLGNMGVPRHPDGTYHVHADDFAMANLFQDTQFQNVVRGNMSSMEWQQGVIARALGMTFILNNQCPLASSVQSQEFFAPSLSNATSVPIHRMLVTGMGYLYEKYVDEQAMIAQSYGASIAKIGSFPVISKGGNSTLMQALKNIRYVINPPIDTLGQKVRQAWSTTRGWGIPSDFYNHQGVQRLYHRAVVYEAAGS